MAIYKVILKNNGIKTMYHRISSIAINYESESCIIKVDSYKDSDYRELGKKKEDVIKSIKHLTNMINRVSDTNLISVLEEKVKSISDKNKELINTNYIVYSNMIHLDYIPEIQDSNSFYKELLKQDIFSDGTIV